MTKVPKRSLIPLLKWAQKCFMNKEPKNSDKWPRKFPITVGDLDDVVDSHLEALVKIKELEDEIEKNGMWRFKKGDRIEHFSECFGYGVWKPGIFKEYSAIGSTFCTILCKCFHNGQAFFHTENIRRCRTVV